MNAELYIRSYKCINSNSFVTLGLHPLLTVIQRPSFELIRDIPLEYLMYEVASQLPLHLLAALYCKEPFLVLHRLKPSSLFKALFTSVSTLFSSLSILPQTLRGNCPTLLGFGEDCQVYLAE